MYLCMDSMLLLTEFWLLLVLVVMVAVAVTSGNSDVPMSLLVAVTMETFEVFSVEKYMWYTM